MYKIRGSYKRPVPLVAGPFRGMNDGRDPTSSDPTLASHLGNTYPEDPEKSSAVVGRPGLRVFGSQIGAGSSKGQAVHQLTKLDGTEISFVIVAGEIYRLDWSNRTHSKYVSTANLTTASITLSSTVTVYCVTFANTVVINDGVNQPFTWDGSSGAGGLTLLSNANATGWYGKPTVYYGKLFGIRSDDRSTFEWSEENQPNVGYEAGGYLNVWTFGQTDQNPLVNLVGTNEALYVFRARSISAVSGAVTEDFQSAGTREAVSDNIGAGSKAGGAFRKGDLHFLSSDARPCILRPGAGVIEVWDIAGLDLDMLVTAASVYDPMTDLVLHAAADDSLTLFNSLYAVSNETPAGIWSGASSASTTGFNFLTMGLLKNANGRPVRVHVTSTGYIYDHGIPRQATTDATEMVWTDEAAAGDQVITHTVIGPYQGWDDHYEKFFNRVDLSFRVIVGATLNNVDVTLTAAHASTATQQFDLAAWGVEERHKAIGTKSVGRWARVTVSHAVADEEFALNRMRLTAYVRGGFPATP